ncbi:MAG: threonine/serine dehydratase [Cyclobacteriaceae bacterium]
MWKQRIQSAHQLIKPEIRETPLDYSPALSKLTGAEVYLKLENQQVSGSFKIRGVMNKILRLSDEEKSKGLVACSTGNHGAAFAHAVHKFGLEGILFLPETVSKAKLDALKHYNVELAFHGTDAVDTEHHARKYAEENDKVLVHPYNDPKTVEGQGTIAAEILNQLEDVEAIITPVGGGGLIAGVAAYAKEVNPSIQIIGAQPVNSAVMKRSIEAGEILDDDDTPTISDATAGGMEKDSITFPICQELVDDFILVDESEIKAAISLFVQHEYMIVEGASALTLGALIKEKDTFKGKSVVLVVTGKKLNLSVLQEILAPPPPE